jgi:hypothetical protein
MAGLFEDFCGGHAAVVLDDHALGVGGDVWVIPDDMVAAWCSVGARY